MLLNAITVVVVTGILYTLSKNLDSMGYGSHSGNMIVVLLLGGMSAIFSPFLGGFFLLLGILYYYGVKYYD